LPDVPPPPPLAIDPVKLLRARNDSEGIAIDSRTAMQGWLGERLNVGYAIDVLHPRATGVRT
jgi:hypothetical protein